VLPVDRRMYTRAPPGEMYTKAAGSPPERSGHRAPLLAAAAVSAAGAGVELGDLQQQGLLSLAGRAELKLCTWMALAYFFMFTACKTNRTTQLAHKCLIA
jgi:hypothetical protein